MRCKVYNNLQTIPYPNNVSKDQEYSNNTCTSINSNIVTITYHLQLCNQMVKNMNFPSFNQFSISSNQNILRASFRAELNAVEITTFQEARTDNSYFGMKFPPKNTLTFYYSLETAPAWLLEEMKWVRMQWFYETEHVSWSLFFFGESLGWSFFLAQPIESVFLLFLIIRDVELLWHTIKVLLQ